MVISEDKDALKYEEICSLTASLDWGQKYFPSETSFRYTLNASRHVMYIRYNEKLIAFARMVEDGMHCMFYDVAVHPEHQGKKLGMQLMEALIDKVKDKNYVCIGLFCEDENPTVSTFYKKLGFEFATAMELRTYMRTEWE